ncbi:HNH endonuclease [Candidatus Tisiphia endosymbiont of Temnostethus pusillus]|uniref:HNH endonuclease signature motif containing protein n=1 Tax=Candidatus Tisiphia endosymbiont of Temnostethus pusillus TaxID=3139335 RepID=UPI0035C8B267
MLNLTHTNSQTSLRVGTSLRSNPFLITFVDCFGATKVAPRNDARLVFENGKFLQSYGKGLGGAPITIGYDSKNQQYFGFTNKGSSNSGSIFEAISASSNGKYSADILRGVVQPIPVADTTPPKPPSQPTPQPKPLSQSELSAAQFLVDTLTADKRQLQAKENEYHRNILQIAKQNMHDSATKKPAQDGALMQQAYAIGGEMGLDYDPRGKKFIEENPGTALALAAAPYVGMGVGLLGEIGFSAAARLLPTIAAEGGGGSSIFSGSRFANAFFMNESAGAAAATVTRFSASTTAVLPNPNFVIGASAIPLAAAVALKATNDDNIKELWNQFANPTTLTPTQPVKIWDVNKPLPTNINPCAIIDLDANKPIILTTPIPSEKPVTVISTPDQGELLRKLGTLPGFDFAPSELTGGLVESFPDHSDIADSMNILYKKQYPDTVEKINERFPINADLAGQKYPLNKLPEHIQAKYPDSVMVDEKGLMRFEPYTFTDKLERVYRIESDNLTGKRDMDSKIANEIMGIKENPEGYTWHHIEDGRTMIAIPTDLHKAIKHTGGAAVKRAEKKNAK